MGCANERPIDNQQDDAETLMTRKEAELYLGPISAKEMSRAVRYHSSQVLNASQLHQALQQAGLHPSQIQETSPLIKYNDQFNKTDRVYASPKLILLTILLGNDTLEDKAVVLYKLCDLDASNSISEEELKVQINAILNISLIEIPEFVISLASEKTRRKLLKLVRAYVKVKNSLYEFFQQLIMAGRKELKEVEFIEAICKTKAKHITNSASLRKFAKKTYELHRDFDLIMIHYNALGIKLEDELQFEEVSSPKANRAKL